MLKNKKYSISLFIFRRDLRLDDNTGLIKALKFSEQVIPCFIFDPAQVDKKNSYRSLNCIQFMFESLEDLNKQLITYGSKLYGFYGKPEVIVKNLINKYSIEAVFVNKDYTPFSIKRDKVIENICLKNSVNFNSFSGILLVEPGKILNKNGEPYSIFSYFFKIASKNQINLPVENSYNNYFKKTLHNSISLEEVYKKILPKPNTYIWVKGGRGQSLKILKSISNFKNYDKTKDYPDLSTTNLAAYLKFGTSSIREVYHAIYTNLGPYHTLIRQLFWRDFFTHIAYGSPFVFGHAFKFKYDSLKWSYNKEHFKAWQEGKTGFPIIDAGMRQLNQTGFIHNRVRMLVASFLVKDLHIDWRKGEKYFAQKLVDYDPSVNNGNWQWCASTGTDSQPYFRIFNPWLQQKKFDPKCEYIKKYVPELKSLEPRQIHNLYKINTQNYPRPLVDHLKEAKIAISYYKKF